MKEKRSKMTERKNKMSTIEKIFFGIGATLISIAIADKYVYPKLLNNDYQESIVYSGAILFAGGLGFNSGREYERKLNQEEHY